MKKPTKRMWFMAMVIITSLFTLNSCDDDDEQDEVTTDAIEDIIVQIKAGKGFVFEGESISFTFGADSLASTISSYSWTFEGGSPATSTDATPTVTYDATGTFEASLTIIRSSDSKEFTGDLDILVLEKATTAFMADVRTIEQGSQVTFRSTSSSDDNLSWEFEGGSPATSSDPEVVVTYVTAGTFDVTLTSTLNGSETTTTETDYIEVVGAATPTFTASATTIDQRQSVTFTNTTPTTDATVRWTFTGGDIANSTDNEVTVTYPEPGVFDVTLEVTKNNITTTLEEVAFITVNDVIENAFFVSAESSSDGSQIVITYDQPLNDPAAETITISADGIDSPVASIALDASDNTKIVLTLTTPITIEGATILANYTTPGITTPDGGTVEALTDKAVVNNYLDTTLNRFPTGDFEGVTTDQYDVNNGFLGAGNAGAIAADFVDGEGVAASRGLVYTVTGAADGDRRALFGDKDAGAIQLITPLRDATEYTVKAMVKYTGVKPANFELGIINFPFRNPTLVFADMDLTGLVEGSFVEVQATVTTKGGISATGYAIPRLTAGAGDSVIVVDNIEVFAN